MRAGIFIVFWALVIKMRLVLEIFHQPSLPTLFYCNQPFLAKKYWYRNIFSSSIPFSPKFFPAPRVPSKSLHILRDADRDTFFSSELCFLLFQLLFQREIIDWSEGLIMPLTWGNLRGITPHLDIDIDREMTLPVPWWAPLQLSQLPAFPDVFGFMQVHGNRAIN